jgi:hypothetical protein
MNIEMEKTMKKLPLLFAIALSLLTMACNFTLPSMRAQETDTPTPRPPTATLPPQPTKILPAQTATKFFPTASPTMVPPVPIVYYYFVDVPAQKPPAGSVVILPDILVLGPLFSKTIRTADITANLTMALQSMIKDPRNAWTSDNLAVESLTLKDGNAVVAFKGELFAPGGIVLVATRMQILMTIFAEPPVKTALVTIEGKNIANLGISRESEARPADYAFTRAEVESFMAQNAYK